MSGIIISLIFAHFHVHEELMWVCALCVYRQSAGRTAMNAAHLSGAFDCHQCAVRLHITGCCSQRFSCLFSVILCITRTKQTVRRNKFPHFQVLFHLSCFCCQPLSSSYIGTSPLNLRLFIVVWRVRNGWQHWQQYVSKLIQSCH